MTLFSERCLLSENKREPMNRGQGLGVQAARERELSVLRPLWGPVLLSINSAFLRSVATSGTMMSVPRFCGWTEVQQAMKDTKAHAAPFQPMTQLAGEPNKMQSRSLSRIVEPVKIGTRCFSKFTEYITLVIKLGTFKSNLFSAGAVEGWAEFQRKSPPRKQRLAALH